MKTQTQTYCNVRTESSFMFRLDSYGEHRIFIYMWTLNYYNIQFKYVRETNCDCYLKA